MLHNKTVLLGAGGGPLTWVAVEVLRALQRAGAQVRVVLSAETELFVPALTFQALAGGEVIPAHGAYGMVVGGDFRPLTALVQDVAVLLVVPATPTLLAKAATACADEALVRALLLHQGPTLFAFPGPARVYQHPLVQHNLQRLRAAGITLYDQGVRDTDAADELGWSLSPPRIVEAVAHCVQEPTALAGKVVLITAGPTQEPIDPVRHISNRASGKTGFALAEVARRRGARVILVTGPTHLEAPFGVQCIRIQTALEMRQAVLDHFAEADVVIKTAAVADFRPQSVVHHKVKKEAADLSIALERNPDILAELGQQKGPRILVGFAAETQDLLANAKQKVHNKHLDFIVANDISDPSVGFASDDNRVHILDAAGQVEELPTMAKASLADHILDRVQALLAQPREGGDRPPLPEGEGENTRRAT
jgi:phosphopantothenoylcysteine decarboxylase/phosphopantothenate--cysteine ligase